MSANPDSVGNQGEFHSSVPPAKPVTTTGHQLGQPAGKVNLPEFRAQTHPPGSAPREHSHKPNPISTIPGQALNPDASDPAAHTSALDMPGATSRDVYNESTFARPMQGQLNKENKEGKMKAGKRVKDHSGLEGVGATASEETVEGRVRAMGADLPEGVERGVRGKGPGAEETNPASAGEVAAEEGRR